MAVMHTTIIKASMTAYSTAVGPSSFFKKRTKPDAKTLAIENPRDGKDTGKDGYGGVSIL